MLVLVLIIIGVGGGLVAFFTRLLGQTMATALIVVFACAGFLWFVHPLFALVALILGVPLGVGIARGLEGKPSAKAK